MGGGGHGGPTPPRMIKGRNVTPLIKLAPHVGWGKKYLPGVQIIKKKIDNFLENLEKDLDLPLCSTFVILVF